MSLQLFKPVPLRVVSLPAPFPTLQPGQASPVTEINPPLTCAPVKKYRKTPLDRLAKISRKTALKQELMVRWCTWVKTCCKKQLTCTNIGSQPYSVHGIGSPSNNFLTTFLVQ